MAYKTDTYNEELFRGSEQRQTVAVLVDQLAENIEELKQIQAKVEAQKQQLRTLAKDEYFHYNFDLEVPEHIFDVVGRQHNIAQLNFNNSYQLDAERRKALLKLLPGYQETFQERPVVNIDVFDLDTEIDEDGDGKTSERIRFYQAIKEVCDDFGLQAFVDDTYVVNKAFHDERHQMLPEVNLTVDKIMPLNIAITI